MRRTQIVIAFVLGGVLATGFTLLAQVTGAADTAWPDELDAMAAAPQSHRVLLENEHVRVLEVTLQPGDREPVHTHRWPSTMVVDSAARIRYYDAEGKLAFETPQDRARPDGLSANWMGPEGPHAVENIDSVEFHAIRVELKPGGAAEK
jgi:hypothetical protein